MQSHSISQLLMALLTSLLEYHFDNVVVQQKSGNISDDDSASTLNTLLRFTEEVQLEDSLAYQFVK